MEKNNKEKKVTIRFSEKEHETLKQKANQCNKSLSEYIRFVLYYSNQNVIDIVALQELTSLLENLVSSRNISKEDYNAIQERITKLWQF